MGDVDVDVVAEEFDPTGIGAMDGAKKLSFSFIPITSWCERNVGGCVVNNREGTHPEVVHHPRHEPEFDKAPDTVVAKSKGNAIAAKPSATKAENFT
jgi:hypothetical protein